MWPWPSLVKVYDIFYVLMTSLTSLPSWYLYVVTLTFLSFKSWRIYIFMTDLHLDIYTLWPLFKVMTYFSWWQTYLLTSNYTVTLTLIGIRSKQAYVLISIHCDLDFNSFKVMTGLSLNIYEGHPKNNESFWISPHTKIRSGLPISSPCAAHGLPTVYVNSL